MTARARLVTYLAGAAAAMFVFTAGAAATPGDLDPAFSTDGVAEIEFTDRSIPGHPARDTSISAIGVQSDGRFVVAGYTNYIGQCLGHLGCTYFPLPSVIRLNRDGSIDPTFAAQATLEGDFGLGADLVPDAWAIQADDRILLAGRTTDGFYVARLTSDGALDPSFSNDGYTVIPWSERGIAVRLAIQSGGGVVIGAIVTEDQATIDHSLVVMRLDADGSQDMNFGSSGVVDKPAGAVATLGSLAVDSSDRILLGQSRADAVPGAVALIFSRLQPDGDDDPSFGTAGKTQYQVSNLPAGNDPKLVVDSVGRVVASFTAGIHERGLLRLQANGDFDGAFGSGGVRLIDDAPRRAAFLSGTLLTGFAVQEDGSPLVARATGRQLLLGRRQPDGGADTGFAGDGWARNYPFHPFAGSSPPELLVGPDGRILLATGGMGVHALVARYRVDTDPPHDADADGVLDPGDKCPGRYSPGRGCPRDRRSLSIRVGGGGVLGQLSLRQAGTGCVRNAEVVVFAKRPGADRRLGTDHKFSRHRGGPGTSVRYAVELPPHFDGRAYARVARDLNPSRGICTAARSRSIAIGG